MSAFKCVRQYTRWQFIYGTESFFFLEMDAEEMYGLEWCRRRRIPVIHMARMVRARELGGRKPGSIIK